MSRLDENPEILPPQLKARVFGKRITASGFLLLIIAGHFWTYYQIFEHKYPPILDGIAAIGMGLLFGGAAFYIYSYFSSSEA